MTDIIPPKYCIIIKANDNYLKIQHAPNASGRTSSTWEFNLSEFPTARDFLRYIGYQIIEVLDILGQKTAQIFDKPEFIVGNIQEYSMVAVAPPSTSLHDCKIWHYGNSAHFTATKSDVKIMEKTQFQSYAQGYSNAKGGTIIYV